MSIDPSNADSSRVVCAACRREIAVAARLCPYCGADPRTGEKPVDTQAMLARVFQPRKTSASENVVEFARQRQGVVIAIATGVVVLLLAGLHEYVTRRNARDVSAAAAIPLTEVADLNNEPEENGPLPMPALHFELNGNPQTMRTFVTEPGAITPPEVIAAQKAAAAKPAAPLAVQPAKQTTPPRAH